MYCINRYCYIFQIYSISHQIYVYPERDFFKKSFPFFNGSPTYLPDANPIGMFPLLSLCITKRLRRLISRHAIKLRLITYLSLSRPSQLERESLAAELLMELAFNCCFETFLSWGFLAKARLLCCICSIY